MRAIFGIEPVDTCQELISFGTNIVIWRKCLVMYKMLGIYMKIGSVGSQTKMLGMPILYLSKDMVMIFSVVDQLIKDILKSIKKHRAI